ncbi:hypothetical protein N7468_005684 [Penicillium chermesinum]|uniref:DUF803 domain membrane protein n=1 Tax=Penicillium chermesinum TaxID=63820 RepID=A0A9W9NZS1_9EURO|nr:uncharacterized protein N7468_005684 [Penicillium chermesinum]KAJ5232728.1 hypothetical protein N7468_005684 [Penicillium chermesinum]
MDSHFALSEASDIIARGDSNGRPPVYKAIGIALAVSSGVFIGVSFVLKKIGLLKANVKYNEEAGEGYGYLRNVWWWSGMTLMIIGEICNFVAYAFVDAILVTPLGALSVVITTILSAIFLKERLSFVGKVGCFSCIIGSIVIAMNAPEQSSVSDIQEMQHFAISPGFLSYTGVILVGAAFTALWVGPRYGKKSMFVYISICSMVGGLSVVCTQGLGSAILAWINGEPQYKEWFFWVLLAFVICTLLTEIIYLNKALNLFNAALVTPTYYVFFTSATIITSAVLFRGFKGTGIQIATVIMGFLQICSGVVLLQLSKSAKDVPDAAVFKGDLDQIREVVTQEEPESEPKADSIRGAASILRRISTARRTMETEEARRFFHDRNEDTLRPPGENEIIEWDGLRRRKTVLGEGPTMARSMASRSPSLRHPPLPPLGMSRFPDDEDEGRPSTKQSARSYLSDMRSRTPSVRNPQQWLPLREQDEKHLPESMGMTDMGHQGHPDTEYHGAETRHGRQRSDTTRSIHWADGEVAHLSPAHTAQRQFSFNSIFNRMKSGSDSSAKRPMSPPKGILRRTQNFDDSMRAATEEERLGLVKGDSRNSFEPTETLGEKLDRWSSNESEGEAHLPHVSRSRHESVSSMSTAAFPEYEDEHAYSNQTTNVSNPFYVAPLRQAAASPEHMQGPEAYQIPPTSSHSRTRSNSSSTPYTRAPPPANSSSLLPPPP